MIGPAKENLFIVTSTIAATRGIFSMSERFGQTLETIDSIKKRVPNAIIIVADSSIEAIADEMISILQNRGVYSVFRFSNDSDIVNLSRQGLNSPAEARIMMEVFSIMKSHPQLMKILNSIRRIYKISGRYELNDNFSLSLGQFSKYLFKRRLPSWMPLYRQTETNVDHLLVTRLWSMCPSLIDDFMIMSDQVFKCCLWQGLDLEHAMWKHINKSNLFELDTIGVQGRVALSGEMTYD